MFIAGNWKMNTDLERARELARGVVAIGQAAVGVLAFGQVAVGVLFAGALQLALGAWVRQLWHFEGIALVPRLQRETLSEPPRPEIVPLHALVSERRDGWIEVELDDGRICDEASESLETDDVEDLLMVAAARGHDRAYLRVGIDTSFEHQGGYRDGAEAEIRIAVLDLRSFRRSMSVVTQQSFMFSGSVRDNVTYGHDEVDEQRVIDAPIRGSTAS